jgi:hypothetical protein
MTIEPSLNSNNGVGIPVSHTDQELSVVDPPRESIPSGGRDFGLVWSVGAGISGVYRTQQTQLTTSSNLLVPAACSALSDSSFCGPPFTSVSLR